MNRKINERIKIVLIIFLSLSLSGCLYFRLLNLKDQLKEFKKYFSMSTKGGFEIVFKEPVILGKDIRKIMETKPLLKEKENNQEKWRYILVKQYGSGGIDQEDFDIPLNFYLEDNKLSRFVFNKKFPPVFTKRFLREAFKELGHSKINVNSFSVKINLENVKSNVKRRIPREKDFVKLFGVPYEYDKEAIKMSYRFKLEGKKKTNLYLYADITFNEKDKKISSVYLKIKGYNLLF